ncbi:MAG: helix-turn-helix transcriptional regulator [Gammaproteobacteria bacterium]|nr:helix-turn-helix transcriptional regulator [Gammaproteobacteria bacterium]
MSNVSQQDALDRIAASLNEAMLDDARWPETSALIDEACGATGSILTFGDESSTGDIEIFFSRCYQRGADRSNWVGEYFRLYYAIDEHLARVRKLPDSRIVPVADLLTESELRTSLAYNEGLPRYEMQRGLRVRLDGPRGSRIVWAIGDPVDLDGWSSARVDMVAAVLPHIRQYVRVRSTLADAAALGVSVSELLDNTRAGVIQLDRWGRIVSVNDSARELLRRQDGLRDEGGELRAASPRDDQRFQALLGGALPRFGGQAASGSMMVRRRPPMPGFALHVKPVVGREADYRSRHVAALVLIADPLSRARIEPGVVAAELGLTPTETQIALLLAEGLTLRQIAASTGRGYSTVRSHLKQIFAKLGCSRQFEVAQAVLALSDLPGARR